MIHGLNLMKRIGEFLHGTLVRMLWNHAPTCASGKLLCSLSQKRITIGHGFRQACEVLRPPAEIKLQKAKASARQSLSGGTHDVRRGTDAPGCVVASLPTAGLATGCSSHSIPAVSIHGRSLDDPRILRGPGTFGSGWRAFGRARLPPCVDVAPDIRSSSLAGSRVTSVIRTFTTPEPSSLNSTAWILLAEGFTFR